MAQPQILNTSSTSTMSVCTWGVVVSVHAITWTSGNWVYEHPELPLVRRKLLPPGENAVRVVEHHRPDLCASSGLATSLLLLATFSGFTSRMPGGFRHRDICSVTWSALAIFRPMSVGGASGRART